MDKKVEALLNDQINKEFYSAYLYFDMSNFYKSKGLEGFASWYQIQAKEEEEHGEKIYSYLHDSGCGVTLSAIAKPDKVYKDLSDPLKASLEHEKYVTGLIHSIYAEAEKAKDYTTMQFLLYFIEEQAEEEKNASELISKMENFGSTPSGLYLLDKELGERE